MRRTWAQRAEALQGLARIGLMKPDEGFRAAHESAEKAIALDPNLATGYLALGLVQISYNWDWEGADASLSKAAQLEPGSAAVLSNRAYLARHLGHLEDTIALSRQALALDPLRANAHLSMGYVLYLVGRYDEAKTALQKAQELNSRLSGLHLDSAARFSSRKGTRKKRSPKSSRRPATGINCRAKRWLMPRSAIAGNPTKL